MSFPIQDFLFRDYQEFRSHHQEHTRTILGCRLLDAELFAMWEDYKATHGIIEAEKAWKMKKPRRVKRH